MKRILSFVIFVVLCIISFCGCTSKTPDASDASDVVTLPNNDISYDKVSYFVPEASDVEESDSEVSQAYAVTGGFSVKTKTYIYQGKNLALVDIQNETNKNYSVTVKASYLDADGKVLKTETQEFQQFASGYQKYFLFRPNIEFDKFTYELETKEFFGECAVCDLVIETPVIIEDDVPVIDLILQGDSARHPSIIANFRTHDTGSKTLQTGLMYVVVIGNDENIYMITQSGAVEYEPHMEKYRAVTIYYTTDEQLVWPEVLNGGATCFVVTEWISVKD